MKIISTNTAEPTKIMFNGKEVLTGIYKIPTTNPIFLGRELVKGDEVSDRKHHGGIFKACYLFSADYYPYWKNLYPNLNWNWGMLGENITVSGLDETQLYIGDIYKVGQARIQITQPREPCFKFGVKFGNQGVLQQFIDHGHPGTYVRVLEEGLVAVGDTLELVEQSNNSLTTSAFFNMLYDKVKNQDHLVLAMQNEAIPLNKRQKLAAFKNID